MIALLKRDSRTTVQAFDMPNPDRGVEDDRLPMPEIVVLANQFYVLRGLQWNSHANRHELIYELSTVYVV